MGVGVILSEALRRLGVESRVLSQAPHPFGFKEDYLFPRHLRPWRGFFRRFEWKRYYDFDILHSHDNLPLPSYVLDHYRGRLIQHYHDPKVKVPLYRSVPSLVSLPSILKVVPDAAWLPIPVDTDQFSPVKRVPHEGVWIGYSAQQLDPTKQRYVPTVEIEAAVKKSRSKTSAYPLREIVPNQLMPHYYGQLDIWVDRIGHNFYGFSAVEAAAMGIPVITQIGEDEAAYVSECPFINVNREGVTEAILSLVEDEGLRRTLGERARRYVFEVHDWLRCARLCLEQYRSLSFVNR